jgi:hypothetical protein
LNIEHQNATSEEENAKSDKRLATSGSAKGKERQAIGDKRLADSNIDPQSLKFAM